MISMRSISNTWRAHGSTRQEPSRHVQNPQKQPEVWPTNYGFDKAIGSVQDSAKKLGLEAERNI